MEKFKALFSNKHTSGASTIYLVLTLLGKTAKIWATPEYHHNIDDTVATLKDICFVWLGYGAADARNVGQIQQQVTEIKKNGNGHTTFTEKPPEPTNETKT